MIRRLLALALVLVLVAGLAVGGFFVFKSWLLARRAAPDGPAKVVEIPKGSGLSRSAEVLAKAGVVDRPRLLVLAGLMTKKDGPIQAGEYELSPAMSAAQILRFLRQGRVRLHTVLLPEGYTMDQMLLRLASFGIVDLEEAQELGRDPEFAAGLGIDQPNLEGYLFPNTYRFPKGMGARAVLGALVRRFKAAWRPLAPAAKALKMSQRQAVILASIIEKEAARDSERTLISAVYHNRLKKGMRLQADPTVIYGLGDDFDGNLTRAGLNQDTPYNTYLHKGLPPGPISSPGKASLYAAVHPAKVPYLYFVATGNGGAHKFSTNYAKHKRAVDKYQRHKGRNNAK
jgi:peptidoglycan lytic transglycosylase G